MLILNKNDSKFWGITQKTEDQKIHPKSMQKYNILTQHEQMSN